MSKLFRFLTSIFLLTLTSLSLKAEVFMVTSNADAGAGTLREALTKAAANGVVEKDYIHFNLPDQSEAGRTITLLSQLPDVSSNLDIDGSTQPGIVFGVSTAKVQIVMSFPHVDTYYGLTLISVNDVGIYGLYLRTLLPSNTVGNPSQRQGVLLRYINNVKIGAAGKGNVICGFRYDIGVNIHLVGGQVQYYSENLTLQSSIIGFEADGKTIPANSYSFEPTMHYIYGLVNIGGSNSSEGNVFAKGISVYQGNSYSNNDPLSSTPATIYIRNNNIGTIFSGDIASPLSSGINLSVHTPNGKNTTFIEDNVICSGGDAIRISNNGMPVIIKRNFIGVDKTLTKRLQTYRGFFGYYANDVTIGGQDPADANYIAYCKPVSVWPYSSVTINKNSFFCTTDLYPMILDTYGTRPFPKVEITSATANSVVGTATPNSEIELFYSDLCGTCSPETYFASTTADANGNWTYAGTILRSVIASATLNGTTSEFTRTRVDVAGLRITNTCANTGSIIGALPINANYVQWLDELGNVVGTETDLLNVPIGKYRLKAVNGNCSETTPFYEIRKGLVLNANNILTINPSCGIGGSIRNLQVINNTTIPTVYSWKNEAGIEVGTTQNLLNVPAGTYTLTIRTTDNSCSETYGPVTLTNASGPNISLSSLNITGANCGTSTGSITGITATGSGTITYKWKNENGSQVAVTKDLINQPPGRYVLEVTDQSGCGIVSTSPITILEANGITINDSQKQIFNPTCIGNNGSIGGLDITGATTYSWKNEMGQELSTQLDLTGLSIGRYQLTAENAFCSRTYDVTLTAQPNLINIGPLTKILTDASCGLNNGKIEVILQNSIHSPRSYRWQNQSGQTIGGNSLILENIDAGSYDLYGTDDNGCEVFIIRYGIGRQPVMTMRTSDYAISDDNCNQRLGSITGLQISGGVAPYIYRWTNEAGVQVGNNLDARNLPAGNYTLQITDALNCTPLFASYTINNQSQQTVKPSISPIQLCAPGDAILKVNAIGTPTSYALYLSENSFNPIETNTSGLFKINVNRDVNYYVTQRVGDCESEKVEVKVTVGLSGLSVANTITPNNDGINDVWNLKGIENYPKAQVQIFSRAGVKVYDSIGYRAPFDGTNKGTALPVGAYYYIIKLDAACELVTGTLTLIR